MLGERERMRRAQRGECSAASTVRRARCGERTVWRAPAPAPSRGLVGGRRDEAGEDEARAAAKEAAAACGVAAAALLCVFAAALLHRYASPPRGG
jgi:hypothetical protein